jgi:hypothetical protein
MPDVTWIADGHDARKGLSIAGLTSALTPLPPRDDQGRFTSSAITSGDIGILGLWSCPAVRTGPRAYAAEVSATISAWEDWLAETPSLIAGDFNIAPGRKDDLQTGALRAIFERLSALGYSSLYHWWTGEAYGSERTPTYYHRRHLHDPWHIDFCFAASELLPQVREVTVGDYEHWVAPLQTRRGLSDHVPLIVDLDV